MNTKAQLQPPPKRNRSLNAEELAKNIKPADNMNAKQFKDLSFRVDAGWHARFKAAAAVSGISMKEILEEGFELWVANRKGK